MGGDGMSIATEISRISQNVSDSLDAVAAKGVTVPSGSTSDDLPSLIAQIQTSSGSAITITDTTDTHGGTIRTITGAVISGTKQITANGTNIDVTSYAAVDVAVPSSAPTLETVEHVQPSESSQTVTPDTGYDALASVQIDPVSSSYVGSGVTRRSSSDLTASGATVTAPAGYYDSAATKTVANGAVTAPSTISGTSATVSTGTNTLTLTKTVSVTPSVTTAGYISSGTAGNSSVSLTASVTTQAAQTIHPSTADQSIASGRYLTGAQTVKAVTTTNLTADNIKSGVVVKIGDSTDDDCVTSVTGTYSGGTSKNTQVLQSTSRTTATSLTKVLGDMTVSKTGTYDVYWSGARTNTSSSYTWGTRLYVDGTGYGTENTTWSNNVQSNHLTNISLTANQKLSVYARGRGGSYYACVPMLVIVEN